MVEVLGPWLVPVEAVVSDPTAGAKMKSMSPSVDKIKSQFRNVILILCLSERIRTLSNTADYTDFPPDRFQTDYGKLTMEKQLKRSLMWVACYSEKIKKQIENSSFKDYRMPSSKLSVYTPLSK